MVRLHRYTASDPPSEGIYYCVVEDDTFINQTVYVELYNSGGGGIVNTTVIINWQKEIYYLPELVFYNFSRDIGISVNMIFTLDSDLNGASPQFTLTCISTGGPATTVTVTEGNETVLDNRTTSQYTHTLTVTGGSGMGGDYTCTVANNKPSEDSANYTVQGI